MKILRAAALIVLLVSCRPVVSGDRAEDYAVEGGYDFPRIFQSFWSGMNHNYLFWDMLPVDYWDAIYDAYKPKFEALGVCTGAEPGFPEACKTAYGYFIDMTSELSDGHLFVSFDETLFAMLRQIPGYQNEFNFNASHKNSSYSSIRPALDWIQKRPGYTEDDWVFFVSTWTNASSSNRYAVYNYSTLIKKYLDDTSEKSDIILIPGMLDDPFKVIAGRIPISNGSGYILYFYSSLQMIENSVSLNPGDFGPLAGNIENIQAAVQQFLEDLKDPSDNLKGIIMDLRGNQGGSDVAFLGGRFLDKDLHYSQVRPKMGEGRLDYGEWMDWVIPAWHNATERLQDPNLPIVALTDKLTGSAAEMLAALIQQLPEGYLIGEYTTGAASMPFDNVQFNAGRLRGNKFWQSITMSAVQNRYNGVVIEKRGLRPDEEIPPDWNAFFDGTKDARLEAAIKHIDPERQFP